jgi:molybdenum cofactor cytidylyltransferase
MIAARAVILAAGTSSRVGKQKLLLEFRGRKLIEYPIAAALAWSPLVVASPDVARYLEGRCNVEVLLNDRADRGMSYSLGLANRAVAEHFSLIVLLGDKPLVSKSLIETICSAVDDADLIYPIYEGVPGHPVLLSPQARRRIDNLPAGDTLRCLRDDPNLRSRRVRTSDRGSVFDVDSMEALEG